MSHIFLSAGDTSGDQHAARLVASLRQLCPDLEFEGLGGPALMKAGVPLYAELVSQAIIGIRPALKALPQFLGLLRRVGGALDARPPDVVVLVDYPGLNLFIARMAHRRGIPVVYFVAPQLWAWAPWRVRRFARVVDEALVIFPFEEKFFRDAGIPAHHIGHPVLDGLTDESTDIADILDRPRPVALLPGSRPREVRHHMPMLLETAAHLSRRHPDASFHSAHVSPVERENMDRMANEVGLELHLHDDDVRGVMASCRCALVASGTATLETAMLGTPLAVFYRITPMEDRIRKWLLVTPFVGQVNLVAGRRVTPEVILAHDDCQPLVDATEPLLHDSEVWRHQKQDLAELQQQSLGDGAVSRAAQRIADRIIGLA
jgi:lipid-A-disaccharide synthase